jgi:hypothetical protein
MEGFTGNSSIGNLVDSWIDSWFDNLADKLELVGN